MVWSSTYIAAKGESVETITEKKELGKVYIAFDFIHKIPIERGN